MASTVSVGDIENQIFGETPSSNPEEVKVETKSEDGKMAGEAGEPCLLADGPSFVSPNSSFDMTT